MEEEEEVGVGVEEEEVGVGVVEEEVTSGQSSHTPEVSSVGAMQLTPLMVMTDMSGISELA
eukprot:780184-Rhodomonas_salina.1